MPSAMVVGEIWRAAAMVAAAAICGIIGSPVRKLATVKCSWSRERLASEPSLYSLELSI